MQPHTRVQQLSIIIVSVTYNLSRATSHVLLKFINCASVMFTHNAASHIFKKRGRNFRRKPSGK